MPELPDVEIFRRYLDSTSLHRRIEGCEALGSGVLREITVREFQNAVRNRSFESSSRLGKYLFAKLDSGQAVVFHFGMTGFLHFSDCNDSPPYTRILLTFQDGCCLAFSDQRKLGKIFLTGDDPREFGREKKLGPDALSGELDLKAFRKVLAAKKGAIKPVLMDQHVISGIGNVYSDEILFQAGIHPETPVSELGEKDLGNLYRKMRSVLETAIRHNADTRTFPESYLLHNRKKKAKCPRCGHEWQAKTIRGRTAYFCLHCQR